MKVKYVFLLLLCVFLMLSGCRKQTDYLSYQIYPMKVKGTLTVDTLCTTLTLEMKEYGKGEIIFDSPERLKGYRLSVDNNGIWINYEDIRAELNEEGLGIGASLLVDMFSCKADTLSEISKHDIGKTEHTRLVYPKEGICVAVYLAPGKTLPTQIEAISDDSCAIFAIDSISYR